MKIDSLISDLSKNFLSSREDEIKQQLSWLIDRGILVIHQTVPEIKIEDGKLGVSQRLGVAVETERYINDLELKISKLGKVVDAARKFIEGGHYDTCGFALSESYVCSCGAAQLDEALKELEGGEK